MQNINVNIVPDNFPQTIRYSQGDIGRQFKINVTDFDIPVGATVKIQATKPSGFGFSVAGVVAGSSVTFTTTAEMTDEAGRFQAELQITAGDDVIGTANFLMIGERNPHPEGTTDGSQGTIIPELTLLVERVEKAASDVLDMEVVATTLPAGSQATYSYDEALNKATFGIPEGQAGAGAAGVVASAYSAAKTYKVGDYVLYNSNLYRCTTAITTAEAWTAAHWTQVVLADDVTDLKTDLSDETSARILLAGRVTTAESNIDTLETHKVAQPLDEYNQPTDGTDGQSLRTKGDGTTEWADVGLPTDAQTAQAVSDWLNAHPEATTTVQDGSLTEAKFTDALKLKTIKDYVTPEMFGAVGDGETDDTQAWQNAVDSGFNVLATKSIYKCGQIDVTQNIVIDCNNAEFICTEQRLFNCSGNVTKTLANEADYVAFSDYSLSENYTGFAMLQSQDNVLTVRNYYVGGFVTNFVDGKCTDRKPVGFTGVTVLEIEPIICSIKNVGNVSHPNTLNYNYTIYCTYGYKCLFENIYQNGEKYNVVTLDGCQYCTIKNVNANIYYSGADANFYGIELLNSSNNYTVDCNIHTTFWHCWTTGGNYFCYNNVVDRCCFTTDSGDALCDHANAIGTIVKNSEISCIAVAGNSTVRNIILKPTKTSKGSSVIKCTISLMATNLECGNFDIENILATKGSTLGESYLIDLSTSAQVKSHFILNDITIKNIVAEDKTKSSYAFRAVGYASTAYDITFKGTITIDNVQGNFLIDNSASLISFAENSKMFICNLIGNLGVANTSLFPNIVEIRDSAITLNGTFNYLRLNNVQRLGSLNYLGRIKGGTSLEANGVFRLVGEDIKTFDNAVIYNMFRPWDEAWAYVIVNTTVGDICGKITANGIVNTSIPD